MDKKYRHSDFINCEDIADFAKIYAFKDDKGKVIGRNKVFKIFRELGILDKQNVPYQGYMQHFRMLEKDYHSGVETYRKTIVFIKPDSLKYFADKINDHLEKISEKKFVEKTTKEVQQIEQKEEPCGSPLDFSKEDARKWYESLPEILKDKSQFAIQVREKWGFA